MPELPTVNTLRHPGGWAIVPVHYSMDPLKDIDWVAEMRKRGEDDDWEKEYEINFASVTGVRCFGSFSLISNTKEGIEYEDVLPIRLTCDFNVDPMAWLVTQVNNNKLYVLREIWSSPGDVVENCEKFLNDYGDHYGEVHVYGDASGNARSQRDQRSNYDEIKLRFMNRPFKVRMRVPSRNPTNVNTVRAVNRKLNDKWGNPMIFIDKAKCKNLVLDLTQVVWQDEGAAKTKTIKKVKNRNDPYFYRTHASDALGAIVHREWPTRKELSDEEDRKKPKSKNVKKKRKRRLRGAFPT